MTEEEGNYYITLATLHGPSTVDDLEGGTSERGTHDPLTFSLGGVDEPEYWWVFRDAYVTPDERLCRRNFDTRAEAARHYCLHYGLIKP
ncbi:hypothetical protein CWO91_16720 [Bradyrhizobium genosp. SA-3]|uniref:hypothetical protein n=1 Tax=Bradyrhizobium genosp. SA-3 TaxID=508868 RepID=UPI00102A885C|nr:hypothetical protein [Bradyrhizobium genosp. SA-3]RZN09671.1 hypothetical protein CWO91_16720 [Bradyrhizobium genosp. SA-3]